jgi:hypothetical protein
MDHLESLVRELKKVRKSKNNPLYYEKRNLILGKIYKEYPVIMQVYEKIYYDKNFNNMIYSIIKGSNDLNESKSRIFELIILELPKFSMPISWEELLEVIEDKTNIHRNKFFKYFYTIIRHKLNVNSDYWENLGYTWNIDDQWELEAKDNTLTFGEIKKYLPLLTEEQKKYIFNILKGETLDTKSKEFLEIKKILTKKVE